MERRWNAPAQQGARPRLISLKKQTGAKLRHFVDFDERTIGIHLTLLTS
jgi:hypothetical protein